MDTGGFFPGQKWLGYEADHTLPPGKECVVFFCLWDLTSPVYLCNLCICVIKQSNFLLQIFGVQCESIHGPPVNYRLKIEDCCDFHVLTELR